MLESDFIELLQIEAQIVRIGCPPTLQAVDLVSRLGASLGFINLEPGLAPKRLRAAKKITSAIDYLRKQRALRGKALKLGGVFRTAR